MAPRIAFALLSAAWLLLPVASQATATGGESERVRIAVLDTGIDPLHPEFETGQVVAWRDFVNGRAEPYDDHWHGTATASLAAGLNAQDCSATSPKLSFAAGAPLVVAKVLDERNDLPSHALLAQAIDWSVAEGARVVSISIGSATNAYGTDSPAVAEAVARASAAGVLVVFSAGNGATADAGLTSVSGIPWPSWTRHFGNLHGPLFVGKASRSGAAPVGGAHLDPDLTSWGVGVCAAYGDGYSGTLSGSSFAAPLVAGMAARAMEHADAAGAPSDGAHVKALLLRSARNDPLTPYAQEGMGFLLDGEWPTVTAHAALGTLPDYDAQGPHAAADRAQLEHAMPLARSLT